MKRFVVWVRKPEEPSWMAQVAYEGVEEGMIPRAKEIVKSKGYVVDHLMLMEPLTAESVANAFRKSVNV